MSTSSDGKSMIESSQNDLTIGANFVKIVILGAGKVGVTLTSQLMEEDHDLLVIDREADKLDRLVDRYDVLGIVGNGATFKVLEEAQVESCDIFIAVTDSDELNLLAGLLAKRLGAKDCIVRVRNPEYLGQRDFMKETMGLSMIVNPELEAAFEIRRMLLFPAAVKVDTFVNGRIELAEFRVTGTSLLVGLPLKRLSTVSKAKVLICAINHQGEILIPDGNAVLQENDRIYVVGQHNKLVRFCQDIRLFEQKIRRVMIVGGGRIAYYLATQLAELGLGVKIIEKQPKRARELSEHFPHLTVIQSDGSDEVILEEEGLARMDAFVALTGLDEENIVMSLYAKQQKVKKTIAKVTRMDFAEVLEQLAIDSVVSPKRIVANQLLSYVRAKNLPDESSGVKRMYKLIQDQVEALEFVVTEHTSFKNQPLKNVDTKDNLLIAAISRNKQSLVPDGETVIRPGDHVVIVAKDQKIQSLEMILKG